MTRRVEGSSCDNSWNGPGASAANTGVSPGPDHPSISTQRERTAPAMVEPTSSPVIHRPEDQWAYEHIARSQTCPVCFGTVAKQHTRENRNVMLATYVCVNDHLFEVRWGLAQVSA